MLVHLLLSNFDKNGNSAIQTDITMILHIVNWVYAYWSRQFIQ